MLSIVCYDTPATSASITYTVRAGVDSAGTMSINQGSGSTITYGGSGASAFTIQEIL